STDPETLVAVGWNQYDRGGLDLTASLTAAPVQGFAKLYRTFGEHRFDPKDGWHSTDYTNGVVFHFHRDFAFRNLVQAGVELKNMSGTWIKSDTSRPSWSRNQLGIFVQDEQRFGPLTVNAGVRYEHDNISGGIIAPKAGVVLRLPAAVNLRASLNRGFRFAPLNYTSVFPPKNPDLKPEVSWNCEAGVSWEVMSGIALDVAGYVLHGENLIETGPNPNPPPAVQFQNKGRFRFRGLETGVTARRGWFRGSLAGTLADYGVNTRARPGLKLDVSAGLELGRVDAEVAGHGVGRYFAADSSQSPIPAYATLDVRAGYRLVNWLRVSGRIENLLDVRYDAFTDLPGAGAGLYQQPGRAFTLALDIEK
ncbi:MAG: TonB-dependent receptor, partial [candidate division WOR-3 bacterium]